MTKLVNFTNLPEKLPEEKLADLVQFLRINGDCQMCHACKQCELRECLGVKCDRKGLSVVNFIIQTHVGLAVSLALRFGKADLDEHIGVSLLGLVEAANNWDRLIDNNIGPYLTSRIVFKLRKYRQRKHFIRVPNSSYLRSRQTFKVDQLSAQVGKGSAFEIQLQVRETIAQIIKSKHDMVIMSGLLHEEKTKEIAEKCRLSSARISQIKERLIGDFIKTWNVV